MQFKIILSLEYTFMKIVSLLNKRKNQNIQYESTMTLMLLLQNDHLLEKTKPKQERNKMKLSVSFFSKKNRKEEATHLYMNERRVSHNDTFRKSTRIIMSNEK